LAKKIILIDGNSLAYRAFYALPTTLTTSSGQITNAVYGFTSMLIRLFNNEKPDMVAVAFDRGAPTFRHHDYEDYKAHRQKMPEELYGQLLIIKELLETLKIPIYEIDGYEADDVLGTLAKKAEHLGLEVIIVTSDKDALQLVSLQTKIMTTKRGITDIVVYDRDEVIERYGLPPEKIVDMMSLKGDSSDNIPGVPGIGEKTAIKLIQNFGSLDEVLSSIDKISAKKVKSVLEEYREQAELSRKLATIVCDVPIDINLENSHFGEWDEREVKDFFNSLELNTLLKRLYSNESGAGEIKDVSSLDVKTITIENINELDFLINKLNQSNEFIFEIEGERADSIDAELKNIAFVFDENESIIVENPNPVLLNKLKPYFESCDKSKITYNVKAKIHYLRNSGINLSGIFFDTMIAAYLINSAFKDYSLSYLSLEFFKTKLAEDDDRKLAEESTAIFKLKNILENLLLKDDLMDLFLKIEMPLIQVLAKMEFEGIGVNTAYLKELENEISLKIEDLSKDIFTYAGHEFNINSPRQLGIVLFEKLGLTSKKKTKTGYATGSDILMEMIDHHPIVEKIIFYRELSKLKSTYIFALPKLVNPKTKRLHTCFNQTGTATGRLSSSNPNLQNIPIRTETGRKIRKAFIPSRVSEELVMADYSQIELRVLAHLTGDESLINAFSSGEDIHAVTAAEIFGVGPDDVSYEMRQVAKTVNFGIIYGMSSFGLSDSLKISVEEAKTYIDEYFNKHLRVRKFIDRVISEATKKGYVETIFKRRRYIPELTSSNQRVRQFGERMAVNSIVQGSAADIIKLAMVKLNNEFEKRGFQTKMVLQVHDELIFETPLIEKEFVISLVRDIMENIHILSVDLKVNIKSGTSWEEVK
jgi:DNA polymerase-1